MSGNFRLKQFYDSKKSPVRMLGYLAAPLAYWPTQSIWYALGAAIVAVWAIDRVVRSRIRYPIRLYETAGFTELPLQLQDGHRSIVQCLAFSPAGDCLASCGIDGTVRLWDLSTGRVRRTLGGHTGYADGVSFSPDGGRLLSHGDREILVHDIATGESVLKLDLPGREICTGAGFSADGTHIAFIAVVQHEGYYGRNCLRLYDLAAGRYEDAAPEFGMHALAPDCSVAAAESFDGGDGEITLWSCNDGRRVGGFPLPGQLRKEKPGASSFRARQICLSQGGRTAVVASADGEVRLIDTASGETRASLRPAELGFAIRMRLSADESTLFASKGSGYQHQLVLAYAVSGGELKGRIDNVRSEWGIPFALSADGATLAIAGENQPPEQGKQS